MAISPERETVFTVLQLTRHIKNSLEQSFPAVWVKGEVSGFKRAPSGHVYFSLKEGSEALIDCALWRTNAGRVSFQPEDGHEVEAFGAITVFEPRGRYQLIVQELRPAGRGALWLEYERLKKRLHAEGLFDTERKQPLPRYPTRIGVVTSPVGAAVRDIITVLHARWPSIAIVLAPVRVQGPGAAEEIAAAIQRFERYGAVDLLIVGRGGGSIEDLWAFNEEVVVRAIATARLPIISAVGHEVDTTLADLVADRRAATPSNAAEIAVPVRADELRRVVAVSERMMRTVRERVRIERRHLDTLLKRYGFRRRRDVLAPIQQRIDALGERLHLSLLGLMRATRERLAAVRERYGLREWPREIEQRIEQVREAREQLDAVAQRGIAERRARLAAVSDRLRALSPRQVLERGFCIVRAPDGSFIRTATQIAVGDRVALEFARGGADARVETVRRGGEDESQA